MNACIYSTIIKWDQLRHSRHANSLLLTGLDYVTQQIIRQRNVTTSSLLLPVGEQDTVNVYRHILYYT
jgi:hypothetical protein